YSAAGAIILFMLPNPRASYWASRIDDPAFFRNGIWRTQLTSSDTILPLPFGQKGWSMLWHANADMSFSMATGWTTIIPSEFARLPIVNFFFGAIDLPEADEHLKAFIAANGVTAIVADLRDPDLPKWKPVLDSLGVAPTEEGGVLFYRIARGAFDRYARLTGEELEARAAALRCDLVIEAAARFVAEGGDSHSLSAAALKNAGVLPQGWMVSPLPSAFFDYWVGPSPAERIQVGIRGSYAALKPLAERYRARAARIYYPYPDDWSPSGNYGELRPNKMMIFEFDTKSLEDAAAALRNSPPPERIRPFLPNGAPQIVSTAR
ncbi:MAG TPA: hypothetical protein VIX12_00340, partial [Candidatus Binataceae bacterium]